MRHNKGVLIGVMGLACLVSAGCKPNQPVGPRNPSMQQGMGGSETDSSQGTGTGGAGTDSSQGTGTGGAGLSNDTGASPVMGADDAGTGGSGMQEPAPGTTQGNDSSHQGMGPDAHEAPQR